MMMSPKRLTILFVVMLGCASPASAKAPVVGQPAPPFEVTTFDGQKISLSDLRGEVVVLNFWATWCGPCRRELPMLEGYERLRRDVGFRVLAVSWDESASMAALKRFAGNLKMTFARGIRGPYSPREGLPTNYVIDRSGVLRYAKAGAFDLEDLNAVLVPLLNEKTPPATSVAAR